jgi:hypothetical protein
MLKSITAIQLGVAELRGLLERTKIDGALVEDVILGHCYPTSDAPAVGRVVGCGNYIDARRLGEDCRRRCVPRPKRWASDEDDARLPDIGFGRQRTTTSNRRRNARRPRTP